GGQVLQPVATKIRRRHLESLERVEQLWSDDAEKRVLAAAWFAEFEGAAPGDLIRGAGVAPDSVGSLVSRLLSAGRVVELTLPPSRKLLVHADRVVELEMRILAALAALHAENPLLTTHDR